MKIRLKVQRDSLYKGDEKETFQKEVSDRIKREELEMSTLTKLLIEMLESIE